jgi:hypothetical protein
MVEKKKLIYTSFKFYEELGFNDFTHFTRVEFKQLTLIFLQCWKRYQKYDFLPSKSINFIADFFVNAEVILSKPRPHPEGVAYKGCFAAGATAPIQEIYQYFHQYQVLKKLMLCLFFTMREMPNQQETNSSVGLLINENKFNMFVRTCLIPSDIDDEMVANYMFKSYRYKDKPTYNVFYLFNLLDNTTDSFCGSPGNQSVYVRARFEYLSKKHLFKDLDPIALCFLIELNRLLSKYDTVT